MHVVVVEPSRVGQRFIERMLLGHASAITSFADGDQAYDFILNNPDVAVVLTSIELAGRSGLELLWDLRLLAQSGRPIYSIALSATHEEAKLAEALDCGADDFVNKPPRAMELQARLRAATRAVSLQQGLIYAATRDSMTDLLNRRAFFETLRAWQFDIDPSDQSQPYLAILDIDHFKSVNDTHGHDVGDQAIVAVARIAKDRFPETAARIGGEEFALLLNAQSIEQARDHCETLRQSCQALEMATGDGVLRLTVSIGLTVVSKSCDVDILYKEADLALYDAKRRGRNQVRVYSPRDIPNEAVA